MPPPSTEALFSAIVQPSTVTVPKFIMPPPSVALPVAMVMNPRVSVAPAFTLKIPDDFRPLTMTPGMAAISKPCGEVLAILGRAPLVSPMIPAASTAITSANVGMVFASRIVGDDRKLSLIGASVAEVWIARGRPGSAALVGGQRTRRADRFDAIRDWNKTRRSAPKRDCDSLRRPAIVLQWRDQTVVQFNEAGAAQFARAIVRDVVTVVADKA